MHTKKLIFLYLGETEGAHCVLGEKQDGSDNLREVLITNRYTRFLLLADL